MPRFETDPVTGQQVYIDDSQTGGSAIDQVVPLSASAIPGKKVRINAPSIEQQTADAQRQTVQAALQIGPQLQETSPSPRPQPPPVRFSDQEIADARAHPDKLGHLDPETLRALLAQMQEQPEPSIDLTTGSGISPPRPIQPDPIAGPEPSIFSVATLAAQDQDFLQQLAFQQSQFPQPGPISGREVNLNAPSLGFNLAALPQPDQQFLNQLGGQAPPRPAVEPVAGPEPTIRPTPPPPPPAQPLPGSGPTVRPTQPTQPTAQRRQVPQSQSASRSAQVTLANFLRSQPGVPPSQSVQAMQSALNAYQQPQSATRSAPRQARPSRRPARPTTQRTQPARPQATAPQAPQRVRRRRPLTRRAIPGR